MYLTTRYISFEEDLVDLKQQLVSDEPKNKLQQVQPSNANCNYRAEGKSSVGHNVDEASLDPDFKQCELPMHEQLQIDYYRFFCL